MYLEGWLRGADGPQSIVRLSRYIIITTPAPACLPACLGHHGCLVLRPV